MLNHRIIPCLLIKGGGLVKTRRFRNPVYIGDPINAVRVFNDKEVDELIVLDLDATRERRGPNLKLIEELAGECFMPLCYGGGIRCLEDARDLFSLGIEKVSLQTAALETPTVIREIADCFGEQSVVVSVDVKRNVWGATKLFSPFSRSRSRLSWQEAIRRSVAFGAGEILLNSADRDGTMTGMDLQLIRQAARLTDVPLIAAGGAGSLADLKDAVASGASAVAAGALFVFQGPHRAVLISYPRRSEVQALWAEVPTALRGQ
jgi:cyclase